MNLARIIIAIEEKRRELYDAAPVDRLKVSQELDQILNQYEHERRKVDKFSA